MWLWLHPPCLPRPLSGITVGATYFPETPDLQWTHASYIIECIDSVKSTHPDCGVVLLGDFNILNIMNILANHTLKQLVHKPTRGNNETVTLKKDHVHQLFLTFRNSTLTLLSCLCSHKSNVPLGTVKNGYLIIINCTKPGPTPAKTTPKIMVINPQLIAKNQSYTCLEY